MQSRTKVYYIVSIRRVTVFTLLALVAMGVVLVGAAGVASSGVNQIPTLPWGKRELATGTLYYTAPPGFVVMPIVLLLIQMAAIPMFGGGRRRMKRLKEQRVPFKRMSRNTSTAYDWILWTVILLGWLGAGVTVIYNRDQIHDKALKLEGGFYLTAGLVIACILLSAFMLPERHQNILQIDEVGNAYDSAGNPYTPPR